MNDFATRIENICTELVNTFRDQLTWEWDDLRVPRRSRGVTDCYYLTSL